ncbi:protein SERAC1 [Vanessa tameamea]|uniref:Protein SERAC1 n=1 Tax=Vanessa tameamea TaxID=334116 RepID=A0A8B8HZ61_VANTA|nr:protein SERAC1 [Vanessa tameamea]
MSLQDRLKPLLKILKVGSLIGGSIFIVAYHLREICRSIDKIVNANVLDVEKKIISEYIYIDDPSYNATMSIDNDIQNANTFGLSRVWKSLKHSVAWRLLWLCRHGNKEQRNLALEQLASFRNNKSWDCLKIAQALDKSTAVLLARTYGADLRYFLPPPIHVRKAALNSELLSYKFIDMISTVESINPHSCINQFLSKHLLNIQDQVVEVDSVPPKPDSITEKQLCILCLDVLHHHIFLFNQKLYDNDISTSTLIKLGILPRLAELMLRYRYDTEVDLAVLKILTVLSLYTNLLVDFFQNGLIGELARLLKSQDIRLASSAAVCLANLSGEFCYRPGLFLLHPLYRTKSVQTCDTLLVHGLRGGVFVTWRQRDKKCAEPVGIIEVTVSDVDCEPCKEDIINNNRFLDPDLQQVIADMKVLEEEALLSNFEVVLHDLPIVAKREPISTNKFTANKKRVAVLQEEQDKCYYTHCWPKDWLPRDCNNLRILGFNYWSKLSDWLEGCPLQNADIEARADELASTLLHAGVGTNNVVWLAHSMGGLIVKQLLVDAAQRNDPAYEKLCQKTKAVLFYSTPHKGSALATMPRAAAAVLWPSQDVKQLKENSPTLLEMHQLFIKFADIFNWETISFAETLPTLITAFKVPVHFVDSYSADLGRGPFYQLPLDHLSICKPATRQSVLYTTVLDVLQRATNCEVDKNLSDSLLQRLIGLIWLSLKSKGEDTNLNLYDEQSAWTHWYEQVLLDTFMDGFLY